MIEQSHWIIETPGRGFHDITDKVQGHVAKSRLATGLCHLFLHHTSASLILCENADPDVRRDLERFMARLVPDGDPLFSHTLEGPDDMPAHVRSILTHSDITLPVREGRCALGTWQGIYLWEHRIRGHRRHLTVTLYG
ncbi:MAG: YjbQ family protein [Gammaproteobacteria bacterium]|nr:MAG: YjbQ family protein [Gammaproteobacteria bacterium]